jgi:hypothetical protein
MLQQKTTKRRTKGQDRIEATYFVAIGSFHITIAMKDAECGDSRVDKVNNSCYQTGMEAYSRGAELVEWTSRCR